MLYRRSFAQDIWLYYLSSAPLALALLYYWERARVSVMTTVWAPALLLALLAGVRMYGCGAYSRRLLQRTRGGHEVTGASTRLTEMGTQALLTVLWLATLPMVVATCLLYTAAQYVPLGESGGLRASLGLAWRWWAGQWSQAFLGLLFAVILLINFLALALLLPVLAHSLLGATGAWTRAGSQGNLITDPLLWAGLVAAVYLALDPLYKCVMVLTYARLRAVASGADLRQRIRGLQASREAQALPSLVLLAVTPQALQRALGREFQRPVYAWHAAHPRSVWPGLQHGLAWLFHPISAGLAWAGRELQRLIRWLLHAFLGRGQAAAGQPGGHGWEVMVGAVAVVALGLTLAMLWRRKRRSSQPALAPPAPALALDVASAHAGDAGAARWFEEAERLEATGDFRLALRAAFLGGLASLGECHLLTLRRDRTNLEYREELRRRAALAAASVPDKFAAAAGQFESVWYGGRAVDGAHCRQFIAQLKELRSHA